MVETGKKPRSSSQMTRAALIEAALRLFGDKGFAATSTRDIAAAAQANIASIAYHFGGKEGLRLACAQAIVTKFQDIVGTALAVGDPGEDAERALLIFETVLVAMVRFLTQQPQARDIAAFIVREMTHPSAAVELIYAQMVLPFHRRLCRLWSIATGAEAESPATRLAVFAILGQVIYFRLGQPLILKRMDWKKVGATEADQIIATITGNLRALASAAKED